MLFDNHDYRIRYYELLFERSDLDQIPQYDLPEGFRFVFYKPGDRDTWIDIEYSAKEFLSYDHGMESWGRYYEGKDDDLVHRMVFIENADGLKVATASAYYDIYGKDKSGAGWLHWVAVRREFQGMGLSKPLISFTLRHMQKLGYSCAKIPSQTTTWLACKIYLDFGFMPEAENAVESRTGWQILKTLTNHPSLVDFETASYAQILSEKQ